MRTDRALSNVVQLTIACAATAAPRLTRTPFASADVAGDADAAPIPVAVRTPCPPPPPAARIPLVVLHLTPLAPRIPPGTPRNAPCRWASFHGAPALGAVRRILERIERTAYAVQIRANADGEIAFYDVDPDRPIALVCEGLTLADIERALRVLALTAFNHLAQTRAGHA